MTIKSCIKDFLTSLQVRNYSEATRNTYHWHLNCFHQWCTDQNITNPRKVTTETITSYQAYLVWYRKSDGTPLVKRTQLKRLQLIGQFFNWLYKNDLIVNLPVVSLQLPKHHDRLPGHLLSEADVEAIISQPDVTTDLGLRDRAVLETIYSTGIRRSEAANLFLSDLKLSSQTLLFVENWSTSS